MMHSPANPARQIRAVLDTDTYNEIDDQFALAYSLGSPCIKLEAVYAAPFHNENSEGPADGMEKSYAEIGRLLDLIGASGQPALPPRFRGAQAFCSGVAPVESPAALDLIERAMRMPPTSSAGHGQELHVMAIAAPTNIASALLLEPRIAQRIVVVWLGGHPPYWHSADEFNMRQDLAASRVLLDSGVPLVLIPCKNVAEHLRVTVPELESMLGGHGPVAEYLLGSTLEYMKERNVLSKVIWDIAVPAWINFPGAVPTYTSASPILEDGLRWSHDPRRHTIRIAYDVDRDAIFRDLYAKLVPAPDQVP
jgi:inosine-uridine nucleoside N-ribohydrolase